MLQKRIDKFKSELLNDSLEGVVRRYIFSGTPFIFKDCPEKFRSLKKHLCERLGALEENVKIIGSAQTGFSLNPDSFPRQFHNASDIDVLVVDEGLFDYIWRAILSWHYPRRAQRLPREDWTWKLKRTDEIYWGWFCPDKIRFDGLSRPEALKPLRDVSTKWFNAFRGLARYSEFASRVVSGRLYRTWEHAMLYHVNGLKTIQNRLYGVGKGQDNNEV